MNRKILYEIVFAVLALYAVSLAFVDILNKIPNEYETIYLITDKVILAIFAVDYFVRLYSAKDKKAYFKDNIFELLSIIPLDSFFRGFRIFRIIRVIRILLLTRRLSSRLFVFFKTNGFAYVLITTFSTIIIGAVVIYYLEYKISMESFSDALWWSFVTVTTVGYGDLSPETGAGRIMVYGTKEDISPIGECLGKSKWINVFGEASGKWSPEEGKIVLEHIRHLLESGVTEPNVYIITPFRIVAQKLRELIRRDEFISQRLPIKAWDWVNERVGTIHTFQGKEADAVILVLGAPLDESAGARRWAGSKPNILNVAVTRAKRRIFVIGNYNVWYKEGYIRYLASSLPKVNFKSTKP